jgi:hypothetical protein
VHKEIKSQSDTLELQKDLIALEEWEKTWGMSFHPDKCNIICIDRLWWGSMLMHSIQGFGVPD